MKRLFRLPTLAGAIAAALALTSLTPIPQREANASPLFRTLNGINYYTGGYAPRYGGYSGYGYSPYGNGGYTYVAPRAYVYPSYPTHNYYGYGRGYGYGRSGYYGHPYRSPYSPYGYGPYGGVFNY